MTKISYNKESLSLFFSNGKDLNFLELRFNDVVIEEFEFDELLKDLLTLDTLYRGRYQKKDQLIEFSNEGHSVLFGILCWWKYCFLEKRIGYIFLVYYQRATNGKNIYSKT